MSSSAQAPRIVQNSKVRSPADRLRESFESLTHQKEFATDLKDFRPGGKLSVIRYIANAHGVHVTSSWLRVLTHTQTKVLVDTANPLPAYDNDFVTCRPLLPSWLRVPMVIRYFLAGLVLRFSRSPDCQTPIHAHSASGNGLIAWLSGQPYSLITYGSEIYCAKERGFFYCWLLKRILQRADQIYIGSDIGIKILQEEYNIPAKNIHFFHLGYNECFAPLNQADRMALRRDRQLPVDEPVWTVNRRTHPHYRTFEVVQGFLQHCSGGGRGRLVLICGDDQADYTASIVELCRGHEHGDQVCLVKGILTQPEVASWVKLADYSISVPKSDNFSISILESMGCGTAPILADIEGFAPGKAWSPVVWVKRCDAEDFCEMFSKTGEGMDFMNPARREECLRLAKGWRPFDAVIRDIAAFCLGQPTRNVEQFAKAA